MTAQDYKAKIDPQVLARLERSITSLLGAGRDTSNVAETLCPQASFGKYEGCYKEAIRVIAVEICNAENAKWNAMLRSKVRPEVFEEFAKAFPQIAAKRKR